MGRGRLCTLRGHTTGTSQGQDPTAQLSEGEEGMSRVAAGLEQEQKPQEQ